MQNIEQIYNEYFETVKKYLFCLTNNNDIAEELTQETFYRAVQKIDTFKGESKISTWLCTIARNVWYDELRKNKRIQNISEEQLMTIEDENNLEDIILSNNDREEMHNKIQELDKVTKKVIYLRIIGELSFKEIGNILNKTENWARVTFYRGKQKLMKGDDLI